MKEKKRFDFSLVNGEACGGSVIRTPDFETCGASFPRLDGLPRMHAGFLSCFSCSVTTVRRTGSTRPGNMVRLVSFCQTFVLITKSSPGASRKGKGTKNCNSKMSWTKSFPK
jgi:hypothetical protein